VRAAIGPRGVLRCKATDKDDPTEQPRFGKIGKQTIEDTGPLTKKRMETIDDETSGAGIDFIQRQAKAGKPFFCWMCTACRRANVGFFKGRSSWSSAGKPEDQRFHTAKDRGSDRRGKLATTKPFRCRHRNRLTDVS
jgi:hypothetical protein